MIAVGFECIYGSEERAFIWVLFIAGIASEGLPQRWWFMEKLRSLVVIEGISRWSEVKSIVNSFL